MRTSSSFCLALVLAAAGGCGTLRPKPSVTVSVQGDSRMNFVNDRPNAAVVRVYQLTSRADFDRPSRAPGPEPPSRANFARASRAALWRDDSAALGGELVTRRELTLLPDAKESL